MSTTSRASALAILAVECMQKDLLVEYEPGKRLITSELLNGWNVMKLTAPESSITHEFSPVASSTDMGWRYEV